MKRHLNTLYVTSQGSWLGKESETVVVQVDGVTRLQLPLISLESIVCFGRVSCSPPLMHACSERGVSISFLSEHGRFLAKVVGPISGNVLLRREQYRRADDPGAGSAIARAIVVAKIANARSSVLRSLRDRPDPENSEGIRVRAARQLAALIDQLDAPVTMDALRGYEGSCARVYFEGFDEMITQQKESFFFSARSRRPPLDNLNAMLSLVYTLVMHDLIGALEGVGLDPAVGFLHTDRPGRPSLALDLMEEMRPWLADRFVLALINLRQLSATDFMKDEARGVTLTDEGRRRFLTAYQKRKQEEITHPFLGEKITIGLLPHIQALLLARHLRGDLDGYPPFIWK